MSSSSAAAAKIAFNARVSMVKAPKSDINALILDYLTMEGYPKAAAHFSKEANLKPQQDESFIRMRQSIIHAIHGGHIEEAITELNSYDPEILDSDPALHFALLRLQLVELIRKGNGATFDFKPALEFAREQLGPRAPANPKFLDDLEQTMSLLFFEPSKTPPELQYLLSPELRMDVAEKVNKALLFRRGQRREAAIRNLAKMRTWAETVARASKKNLPDQIGLGPHFGHDDASGSSDAHEPMITT